MDSRNTHLKGTRWKNLSRNAHGEVELRQYSERKAGQQEHYEHNARSGGTPAAPRENDLVWRLVVPGD